MGALRGYVDSYIEHSNKIVKASGDPTMVYSVRGWINACRHFAEKAYDEAQKELRKSARVSSRSGGYLDANGIEQRFAKPIEWLIRAERENEELARRYGY